MRDEGWRVLPGIVNLSDSNPTPAAGELVKSRKKVTHDEEKA
jgi:hypothetical protein